MNSIVSNAEKPKVYEVRIRRISELSPSAQDEVSKKLQKEGPDFNFRGYAKVSYTKNSPLSVLSVDPIEGTIFDYFKSITENIKKH